MLFSTRVIVRLLGPNLKILAGPLIIITVVLLLSLLVGKNGFSQVSRLLKEENEARVAESALQDKLAVLREVEGESNGADATVIALPKGNPAALVISNLRLLSKEKEITFEEFSASSTQKKETFSNMTLDLSTSNKDYFAFVGFIKDFQDYAPITSLNSLEASYNKDRDLFSGDLELVFYWSPLPRVIPKITDPIVRLSGDEEEVLAKLTELKRPLFVNLDAVAPKERETPFN